MALDVMRALKGEGVLDQVLQVIASELGRGSKAAIDVLSAAAAVASEDEGSGRILTEQLALTAAAAALRRDYPAALADAFIETRLGRPWRATFGMMDGRFDARALVDYICPPIA
jgi:putative acyl-CoA dehydrogenase